MEPTSDEPLAWNRKEILRMPQELEQLRITFDSMLARYGLIRCLFALAHSVRAENDHPRTTRGMTGDDEQVHYLREYIANQIMGAAAFWGVNRRSCGDR
jgi:hypothetical protein